MVSRDQGFDRAFVGLVPVSLCVNEEKESKDPCACAVVHFVKHTPFGIRSTKLKLNDTRIY